jgi:hypothetical protein
LKKLQLIGVGPRTITWISNFFSGRDLKVKIGHSFSTINLCSTTKGVPQGCILSPLLFNLYISDLNKSLSLDDIIIKQYADDIKAYAVYPKGDTSKTDNLQLFLDNFISWCQRNGLRINPNKSKTLHLGASNTHRKYVINNEEIGNIENNETIRDLGLLFSKSLKWNTHINQKCRTAYYCVGSIF